MDFSSQMFTEFFWMLWFLTKAMTSNITLLLTGGLNLSICFAEFMHREKMIHFFSQLREPVWTG